MQGKVYVYISNDLSCTVKDLKLHINDTHGVPLNDLVILYSYRKMGDDLGKSMWFCFVMYVCLIVCVCVDKIVISSYTILNDSWILKDKVSKDTTIEVEIKSY